MGGTGAEAAIWGRSIEGSLFSTRVFKVCHFSLVGVVVFLSKKREKGGKEDVFDRIPEILQTSAF